MSEEDLKNIGELFVKSIYCVLSSKVMRKKFFKEDMIPSIFNSKPKQEETKVS